jgi:hypothetical protein
MAEGPLSYLLALLPCRRIPEAEVNPPAWIAVPSLIIVTILVLIAASYRIRHMEIRYGSD